MSLQGLKKSTLNWTSVVSEIVELQRPKSQLDKVWGSDKKVSHLLVCTAPPELRVSPRESFNPSKSHIHTKHLHFYVGDYLSLAEVLQDSSQDSTTCIDIISVSVIRTRLLVS